ncbi:MAG: hypothetical protein C4519_00420 [Desulfobacteraceae bacterium]|nr:MAG: hypothetical protein C4519_00420 [Desulfobacteraceae bacterium]
MDPKLLRQLQAVDWDFPRWNKETTSAIHWYPGTFPSQLPAALIEALSQPNTLVFDPYAGIGTTGLEALRLGRNSWCVDQNPVGVLASYVMSGLVLYKAISLPHMSQDPLTILEEAIFGTKNKVGLLSYGKNDDAEIFSKILSPQPDEMLSTMMSRMPTNWEMLCKWYEKDTLQQIRTTAEDLQMLVLPAFVKLIGMLMISSALRPSCSQTISWGHVADKVLPKTYEKKDFIGVCKKWIYRIRAILARATVVPRDINTSSVCASVSMHDWQSSDRLIRPSRGKSELLITSPPYGGAIDYVRAQRLSLYYLGFSEDDITQLGEHEIGSRRKRFSPQSLTMWASELSNCILDQLKFLTNDGYLVIILPHKDHGREEGAQKLNKVLNDINWQCVFKADRSIHQLRTRQKQTWTRIKRETIEIFEYGG